MGLRLGEMVALDLGAEVVAPMAGQPQGCALNPTKSQGHDAEGAMGSGIVQLWLLEVPEGPF